MISDLMMRRPSKRSITALNIASHSSLKRISQNKINEETSSILPSINNLGSNYSKDQNGKSEVKSLKKPSSKTYLIPDNSSSASSAAILRFNDYEIVPKLKSFQKSVREKTTINRNLLNDPYPLMIQNEYPKPETRQGNFDMSLTQDQSVYKDFFGLRKQEGMGVSSGQRSKDVKHRNYNVFT